MKKIFFSIFVTISIILLFSSCKKEEIGGTATEAMAGEWYVRLDAVDAQGKVVYTGEDLFGLGYFHLDTYNTAANSTTEMWIDDNTNFWEFKTKINVDLNTFSFQSIDNAPNTYSDITLNIKEGKILPGAAKTPSGMPSDSIMFTVTFSDDKYPQQLGYHAYKIGGYRYTGFAVDD